MLKLHLGCGKRHIPGFVHVDTDDFPHIDHRHSIALLPMFDDGTVGQIYCCHAFEYFDRVEARAVLAEWHRVLAPGGVLRLAVPDLDALIRVYAKYGELGRILGPLYGRIEVAGADGRCLLYHKTVYDLPSLRTLLEAGGFMGVRRYDWRETEHRGHDDFSQAYVPHMDKENGILISLNVEAQKASGGRP